MNYSEAQLLKLKLPGKLTKTELIINETKTEEYQILPKMYELVVNTDWHQKPHNKKKGPNSKWYHHTETVFHTKIKINVKRKLLQCYLSFITT